MTADAKHLVDEFEALPDPSKREVLSQLLRIARGIDYPVIDDDEFTAAADEIFLEHDRRKSADGDTRSGVKCGS